MGVNTARTLYIHTYMFLGCVTNIYYLSISDPEAFDGNGDGVSGPHDLMRSTDTVSVQPPTSISTLLRPLLSTL
jgi:hypothetical protein